VGYRCGVLDPAFAALLADLEGRKFADPRSGERGYKTR
jgi:hypothetical protein